VIWRLRSQKRTCRRISTKAQQPYLKKSKHGERCNRFGLDSKFLALAFVRSPHQARGARNRTQRSVNGCVIISCSDGASSFRARYRAEMLGMVGMLSINVGTRFENRLGYQRLGSCSMTYYSKE